MIKVAVVPITSVPGKTRREAEVDAVARALSAIFGNGAILTHTPDGAPSVEGHDDINISVSHSRTLAAVAVSERPVGVDVEQFRPQLERVAARFLSPREHEIALNIENGLLRAWTAKEAVFKTMLTTGVDFVGDIVLSSDFASARFRDGRLVYLTCFENLPDNNLLTLAKYEEADEVVFVGSEYHAVNNVTV